MFPPKMIGAVMFGQGLSGVLCNVLRFVCIVSMPNENTNSEFVGCLIYYSLASAILLVCILLYYIIDNTPYAIYYTSKVKIAES